MKCDKVLWTIYPRFQGLISSKIGEKCILLKNIFVILLFLSTLNIHPTALYAKRSQRLFISLIFFSNFFVYSWEHDWNSSLNGKITFVFGVCSFYIFCWTFYVYSYTVNKMKIFFCYSGFTRILTLTCIRFVFIHLII